MTFKYLLYRNNNMHISSLKILSIINFWSNNINLKLFVADLKHQLEDRTETVKQIAKKVKMNLKCESYLKWYFN